MSLQASNDIAHSSINMGAVDLELQSESMLQQWNNLEYLTCTQTNDSNLRTQKDKVISAQISQNSG